MNILLACEESQAVCKALREKGHEAYSCDIQECSGGHPEWHIQGDVLPLLKRQDNGNNGWHHLFFTTADGVEHSVEKWDMIIAFPPCTDLAVSGARHFEKKRADGRQRESIEFFCQFLNAECDKVVIENPVNIISGNYIKEWFSDLAEQYNLPIKPTQTIQPYEFGEPVRKKTCLWLKGVEPLKPTKIVEPELLTYIKKDGSKTTYTKSFCVGEGSHSPKQRSKTFEGIAKAMADQWG